MPEPGNTTRPIGRISRIRSLRLKGAALPSRIQSGLKAICVTLRLSAQQEAIFLGAARAAAVDQDHGRVLRENLVARSPDGLMIVAVRAAGEGDLRTCRQMHFGRWKP